MVVLSKIKYWYDDYVSFTAERMAQAIVICERSAGTLDERWLGLLVSGASESAKRVGVCMLQHPHVQSFKSRAVLVV